MNTENLTPELKAQFEAMAYEQFGLAASQWIIDHAVALMLQAYELDKEWIPCSERLPEIVKSVNEIISISKKVWVYDSVHGYITGWLKRFDKDSSEFNQLDPHKTGDVIWESQQYKLHNVTHWQPLPNPPTK